MKIYLASSWRNEYYYNLLDFIKKEKHEVYDFRKPHGEAGFSWSSVDKNWREWSIEEYIKGLNHPSAQAGFNKDFEAMKWADACILLLPCGRSAHSEAGWMAGAGKPVIVYAIDDFEAELMYKLYGPIAQNGLELKSYLDKINLPKGEVFTDPNCIWKYCPNPDICKGKICINPTNI